ncbi:hypothetical protein [Chondrinema litorale]|uniref:hypothetical protein n=1 Tax=Chondrinema litorale TaxID=2994555 RepID=UPI00254384E2|nr:hypothetical protein [Chondrinema litorale]UZS00035.1 hypothetical protein OQ292_39530 [Chondrinema litorale]
MLTNKKSQFLIMVLLIFGFSSILKANYFHKKEKILKSLSFHFEKDSLIKYCKISMNKESKELKIDVFLKKDSLELESTYAQLGKVNIKLKKNKNHYIGLIKVNNPFLEYNFKRLFIVVDNKKYTIKNSLHLYIYILISLTILV